MVCTINLKLRHRARKCCSKAWTTSVPACSTKPKSPPTKKPTPPALPCTRPWTSRTTPTAGNRKARTRSLALQPPPGLKINSPFKNGFGRFRRYRRTEQLREQNTTEHENRAKHRPPDQTLSHHDVRRDHRKHRLQREQDRRVARCGVLLAPQLDGERHRRCQHRADRRAHVQLPAPGEPRRLPTPCTERTRSYPRQRRARRHLEHTE